MPELNDIEASLRGERAQTAERIDGEIAKSPYTWGTLAATDPAVKSMQRSISNGMLWLNGHPETSEKIKRMRPTEFRSFINENSSEAAALGDALDPLGEHTGLSFSHAAQQTYLANRWGWDSYQKGNEGIKNGQPTSVEGSVLLNRLRFLNADEDDQVLRTQTSAHMVRLESDTKILTPWGSMEGKKGDWLANYDYNPETGNPGINYAIVAAESFTMVREEAS